MNAAVTAVCATWMYSPGGPRLFAAGEVIPNGFVDSPAKVISHGAH